MNGHEEYGRERKKVWEKEVLMKKMAYLWEKG